MTDLTLEILKKIQNEQTNILNQLADNTRAVDSLRSDINLHFAAHNERLSGQLISKIEIRQELTELRERIQRLEKASNLITS